LTVLCCMQSTGKWPEETARTRSRRYRGSCAAARRLHHVVEIAQTWPRRVHLDHQTFWAVRRAPPSAVRRPSSDPPILAQRPRAPFALAKATR
jgi:hypothetical protein